MLVEDYQNFSICAITFETCESCFIFLISEGLHVTLRRRALSLRECCRSLSNTIYSFRNRKIDWTEFQTALTQQTFAGLQDIFKAPSRHVLKTSSIRLQRNNLSSSKTSCRPLERRKIVTLKTSSGRLEDMFWRCLQDVLETNKTFTGDIYI